MADLTVFNPLQMTWEQWSSQVVIDLSTQYNLPNPVEEGLWQRWATELLTIPGLSELGLPDPSAFASWQAWAAAFTQIAA